jgi:hypothetical protein
MINFYLNQITTDYISIILEFSIIIRINYKIKYYLFIMNDKLQLNYIKFHLD